MNIFTKFMNSRLAAVVFIAASFGISGSALGHGSNMESTYNQTLTQALEANKKVKLLEAQWTTVPKLLKKAKAAADKKDYAKANKFAAEALKHAELGIEQAEQQAVRWVNSVPHK